MTLPGLSIFDGALRFFSTTIGKVVLVAVAVVAAYLYGHGVASNKCEARVDQSRLDAKAMDERISAEASKRAAQQSAAARVRATEAEEKLNAYLERNKNNLSCVVGDDDLLQLDTPRWLQIDPIPGAGQKPARR